MSRSEGRDRKRKRSGKKKPRLRVGRPVTGPQVPLVARILIGHYLEQCTASGRAWTSYVVEGPLPLSVNHQKKRILTPWVKDGRVRRDAAGKVLMRPSEALLPEVHAFRAATLEAIQRKPPWAPTGVTAAVILFASDSWLTADGRPRREDADNKVKPTLDAAEKANGVPDELHWQFHVFKLFSRRTRTIVYLFDLGDEVECYD